MIDVMKRLAELDSNNPNVVKAESKEQQFNGSNAVTGLNKYTGEEIVTEHLSVAELQKLSGLTESIAECGPMGMMGAGPMGIASKPTANFSLNASAATGDEVASMLTQIMNLAGVKDAGHHLGTPDHIGQHEPLTAQPAGAMGRPEPANDIAKALSAIDDIESDEGFDPEQPEGGGAGAGDITMDDEETDFAGQMDHMPDDKSPTDGDVGAMADQVRDMADELSKKDPEDFDVAEELRLFDNSPKEHTRAYDPNSFADVINRLRDFEVTPARGGDNPLKAHAVEAIEPTDETGSLAEQLMAEYQQFANEDKATGLSKDTLKSYNDKATKDIAKRITGDDKDLKKIGDRQKGYERASKRGAK